MRGSESGKVVGQTFDFPAPAGILAALYRRTEVARQPGSFGHPLFMDWSSIGGLVGRHSDLGRKRLHVRSCCAKFLLRHVDADRLHGCTHGTCLRCAGGPAANPHIDERGEEMDRPPRRAVRDIKCMPRRSCPAGRMRISSSPLPGKALNYLHGQWPKLVRYAENGRWPISNNSCRAASGMTGIMPPGICLHAMNRGRHTSPGGIIQQKDQEHFR